MYLCCSHDAEWVVGRLNKMYTRYIIDFDGLEEARCRNYSITFFLGPGSVCTRFVMSLAPFPTITIMHDGGLNICHNMSRSALRARCLI